MSKFDPDFYHRYRPLYPAQTFAELPTLLLQSRFRRRSGLSEPYQIADIACGTGHSTLSVLQALQETRIMVVGVEPDPEMLAVARKLKGLERAEFLEGSGEHTGLEPLSVDAVTVGSAFHWMNADAAHDEFLRILKPGGALLIFEYQFPKCASLPELNEWIRREFNLRWKAPGQVPRGDFQHVTRVFRESKSFEVIGYRRVPMLLELDADELTGLILSQSRVLHYQDSLSEDTRPGFHREVRDEVGKWMQGKRAPFDFNLTLGCFSKKL